MNRGYKEIRSEEVRSEPNLSSPLDIMRRMGGKRTRSEIFPGSKPTAC